MRLIRTTAAVAAMLLLTACSAGLGEQDADTTVAGGDGCDTVDLAAPPENPVPIRVGHGVASEEPLWLLDVDDDLATNKGSWYTLDMRPFRGTAERLTAYQADELDAVTISPQAQIRGTARGALDLYAVATLMREAEQGAFSTSFVALEGAGIDGVDDLSGKTIAIVDGGSQLDFLARQALEQGGADPDTDAEYVVFPFPAQEEALRGGQIDVAGLPEPFYSLAMSKGGLVDVFDAADLTDFSYDLLTVSFDRQFVEDNLGAVCAWAADYRASMEFWNGSKDAARASLVGTDYVALPGPAYAATGDYARPADGAVDTEGMARMTDLMVEFGVLEETDRVDVETLVRPGVSIGK